MNLLKRKRAKRGFTLMEAMVSILILGISTISVLGMSAYSAKVEKQSEARTAALNIARTQIDALMSVSQSNRQPVTDQTITIPDDLLDSMPTDDVSAKYSITPIAGTKNLQSISVTIRWRNTAASGPVSSITANKIVTTSLDMNGLVTDSWNNPTFDQLFYTPPPPPPLPSTSGSSTGTSGSSGSSSSSTTGGGSSSSDGSSTSTSGGGGSTGGTTSTPPSTTGGGSGGSTGAPTYTGFVPGGGSKWK
jgi:prepilin-type N-terminal cleavage/methylation domain-containing protein